MNDISSSSSSNETQNHNHNQRDSIIVETESSVPFPIHSRKSHYFLKYRQFEYSYFQPLVCYESNTLTNLLKPWESKCKNDLIRAVEDAGVERLTESSVWEDIAKKVGRGGATPAFDCFQQYQNNVAPAINHNDWTIDEEKNLLTLSKKHGYRNWHLIAEELGTGRTPIACLRHYQQTLNPELVNSSEWTIEEDQLLKESVERYGVGRWQHIASELPGRSAAQCLNRWRKSITCHDTIVTGRWKDDEERALFLAAYSFDVPMLADSKRSNEELQSFLNDMLHTKEKEKKSLPNWVQVAQFVPGKNDVQCREKWTNNLDPSVSGGEFTSEEDDLLAQLVERCGEGNWARIAEFMPGRTDAMVRTRWKSIHGTLYTKRLAAKKGVVIEKPTVKRKALPSKHSRSNKAKLDPSQFEQVARIQYS